MDHFSRSMGVFSYDGKSDPKEFVKSFVIQSAMFNWDEAKQCQIIPSFLKGKAERIYNALTAAQKAVIADV